MKSLFISILFFCSALLTAKAQPIIKGKDTLNWVDGAGKKQGKWILRQVLNRYVPISMFDRPKTGFAVPLAEWLRGPLRDWAEEMLAEDRLRREGYLDPKIVRQRWTEVLKGNGNWHFHVWDILMFQAWLESICPAKSSTGNLLHPQGAR